MIQLRIKEVAEEKGISIARLARKADLYYKTVYRMLLRRLSTDPTGVVVLA